MELASSPKPIVKIPCGLLERRGRESREPAEYTGFQNNRYCRSLLILVVYRKKLGVFLLQVHQFWDIPVGDVGVIEVLSQEILMILFCRVESL